MTGSMSPRYGENSMRRMRTVDMMASSESRTRNVSENRTTDAWLSEALIREIIVQRYRPGLPLREQDIADRYQVSRPSAREALRLAAQAGFVEILQWRGARVTSINLHEFLDLLGLLEDIYARCAALAAERMPAEIFPVLDAMIPSDATKLPDTSDKGQLYRLSFSVGGLIGQHCGSSVVRRMLEQVGRLVLWQQRLHMPGTVETEVESLYAHRLLAAAITSRQRDVAAGAARATVLITRRAVDAATIFDANPPDR